MRKLEKVRLTVRPPDEEDWGECFDINFDFDDGSGMGFTVKKGMPVEKIVRRVEGAGQVMKSRFGDY